MKSNGYHVVKKLYGIHSSNALYPLFTQLFVVWLDKHCMVMKIFANGVKNYSTTLESSPMYSLSVYLSLSEKKNRIHA